MKNLLSSLRHRHDVWVKGLLVLISISLIIAVFPKQIQFKYEFKEGQPWAHEELLAPFAFGIYKTDQELEEEEAEIKTNARPYFNRKTEVAEQKLRAFQKVFEAEWPKSKLGQPEKSFLGFGSQERQAESDRLKQIHFEKGRKFLKDIYDRGIIKIIDNLEGRPKDYPIMVSNNGAWEEVELGDFFVVQTAFDDLRFKAMTDQELDGKWLSELLGDLLTHNLTYDLETSEMEVRDALDHILTTHGMVKKGEEIIEKGDIVKDDKLRKLESLRREYADQIGGSGSFWWILAGQIILVVVLMSLMVFFISTFRQDVLQETRKLTFVLLMVTATVFMASIPHTLPTVSHYVLPFCVLPIMIRTFFDIRFAIFIHFITITLLGFMVPNSFDFILIQLVAGVISGFSLKNLRKRSQLLVTSLIIFVAYSVTYFGLAVIQEGQLDSIDSINLAWFGGSAVLTLLVFPLIFLFEKLFGFLSDVTLMELSDTNSPLLRDLATKAPGTFQHTLQVANLSESAALAVGADPLLIRTGALYHDIGKMADPYYFIENQAGGTNPHDELGYEESAQIIIGHVIRGIEMAKKHNLPEVLIDFIRTHHGTTKTMYFYNSAKNANPGVEIDESNYTYPGPVPYSKETAILMMADSVEAASRSLKSHDAQTIGKLVDGIIEGQSAQGQFANADITFKDISLIKKMFKKMLMNIYHVRIEYPE